MVSQRGEQLGMGRGVQAGVPHGGTQFAVVFIPLHQAPLVWLCARLPCVAPASCSLGSRAGAGEGAGCASALRHWALNGDPLSSPGGFQLSLSLFAGGGKGFWKRSKSWKIPDWGDFIFNLHPLSEIQSPL